MTSISNIFQNPFTVMKVLCISILILLFITGMLFLYNYVKKQTNEGFAIIDSSIQLQHAINTTNTLITAKLASNKINTTNTITPMQLINLQVPAFKQMAYIGNHTFDSNQGVLQQLKAGCRFFTCQIDYIESASLDQTKFCKLYEPCLVWRDNAGKLISNNSANLQDTFKSIGEYGFMNAVSNYQYPIVILLHFVRFPYKTTDSDYKEYLSKVSRSLEVLNPYLLSGGYYRASKENDLFKGDFLSLGNKVIIGTNIDTTLFQKNPVELPNDLDYKIHFHYYEDINEDVDSTAILIPNTSTTRENALIYNIDTLLQLNDKEISKFIQIHKDQFIIVKPSNDTHPSKDEVDILLNTLNVNIILYDYFSVDVNTSKDIISLYGNTTYKTKSQQ